MTPAASDGVASISGAADVALRQRSFLARGAYTRLERRHDVQPSGAPEPGELLGAHGLTAQGARGLEQPPRRQALALRARVGARVGERPHRRGRERGQVVAAFLCSPDRVDGKCRSRQPTSAVGDQRILASQRRERALGHADDVHDVEVAAVRMAHAADEHAGAEAPHAAGRCVQLGLERAHEHGQRRLGADLGQRRQPVERVGDLPRRLDLRLGPARAQALAAEVTVEQLACPGREAGPGARGRRREACSEVGDEPGEVLDVLEVGFAMTSRALAELVVARRREVGRQMPREPGEALAPLCESGDDAGLARQGVPTTGRDGAAVGRVAHRPGRDPVDDRVAREIAVRQSQQPEEDASRGRLCEAARRRAAPGNIGRVEELLREPRVRLVDTEDDRHAMQGCPR